MKQLDNKQLFEVTYDIYKKYAPFFKKLTTNQKKILKEYKSYGYQIINELLRNNKYPEFYMDTMISKLTTRIQKLQKKNKDITNKMMLEIFIEIINEPIKQINELDDIFAKVKKRKLDVLLYRGIDIKHDLKNIKKGSRITFNEFLSTSVSQATAYTFQSCGDSPCCIFIMKITDKIPYIPLYGQLKYKYQSYGNEHEILLPRGTSWKVTKKYSIPLDLNKAYLCNYDRMIDRKRKQKITVYELSAIQYNFPAKLKEMTDKEYYNSMNIYVKKKYSTLVKQNPAFFKVSNNIPLQVPPK
jgi:hypothetical protein